MSEQPIHYNTAGTHILVVHSELEQRWECPPDYLPTALKRGWELAEPEAEEVDEPVLVDETPDGDDDPPPFDPAEHDVAGVEAYLAEHAESDPVEVIRVIELERAAAKPRKTIAVPDGFDPIVTGD